MTSSAPKACAQPRWLGHSWAATPGCSRHRGTVAPLAAPTRQRIGIQFGFSSWDRACFNALEADGHAAFLQRMLVFAGRAIGFMGRTIDPHQSTNAMSTAPWEAAGAGLAHLSDAQAYGNGARSCSTQTPAPGLRRAAAAGRPGSSRTRRRAHWMKRNTFA
jgi:hypothetical protein